MFENAKKALNRLDRYHSVADEVRVLVEAGKFFLTDVLGADEPYRTDALMALSGITWDGERPLHKAEAQVVPPDQVRLVAFVPANLAEGWIGKIVAKRRVQRRKFGSATNTEAFTEKVDLGIDATLSHIEARHQLAKHGYPLKRNPANQRIVEVDWLAAEVLRPDCLPDHKVVWAKVQELIGAAKTQPKTKERAPEARV